MAGDWAALLGPIIQGVASGAADVSNAALGWANYKSEQENQQYLRWAQQQTWQREDTATQRRAEDLEAAGLSKTLAAGSAASTSAPIKTEAPQFRTEIQANAIARAMEMAQAQKQLLYEQKKIEQTEEQNKLLKLQQRKESLNNLYLEQANPEKVKKMQYENILSYETLSARIEAIKAESETSVTQARIAQINEQLKRLDVTSAELAIARKKVENVIAEKRREAAGYNLTILQQEMLIKSVAIDMARLRYQELDYNLGLYQMLGLPTGITPDKFIQYGGVAGSAISEIFKLFRKGR